MTIEVSKYDENILEELLRLEKEEVATLKELVRLKDEEIKALRELIGMTPDIKPMVENSKRLKWLRTFLRISGSWITAVIISLYTLWEIFKKVYPQ